MDFGDGEHHAVGFEDAQLADGFAANFTGSMRPDQNVVRVSKQHELGNGLFKRFGTTGQMGDEIKLDLLKIQKKIDVKRLKH